MKGADKRGTVFLRFNSQENQGTLLDISAGGVQSVLVSEGPLPGILDRVGVSITMDNKKRIEGLDGVIVRIQAVDASAGPGQIHYAVKFMEDMTAEKKRQLAETILLLPDSKAKTHALSTMIHLHFIKRSFFM